LRRAPDQVCARKKPRSRQELAGLSGRPEGLAF